MFSQETAFTFYNKMEIQFSLQRNIRKIKLFLG